MALLLTLLWSHAPVARAASPALTLARQLNQAFIEVAENVSPSVVVVRVAHKPGFGEEANDEEMEPFLERLPPEFRRWFDQYRERRQREHSRQREQDNEPRFDGQGSGVIIRKEGYILTNRHVVEGADKIKVRFKDGVEVDAEVRGVDAQSDLAVIKINPKGRTLAVAKLGDSDKTRVGEFAIAIGAPFELDYSVTFGHVSAKGRSGIVPNFEGGNTMDQDFIQTDASINPGNSGGPLVNIEGEVIGINTLIRGLHTGIGFAIPSNFAREITDKLITDGKFVRAYLGVGIRALSEDTEYRDLITNITSGVMVTGIVLDGPAAKSDLKLGDVITAVEGRSVATVQQLKNEVRSKKIGEPVTLDVHRFGKNLKLKIRPEAWPEPGTTVVSRKPAGREEAGRALGLSVEPISKELTEQFSLEATQGVVVTEVERGSAAERKGIQPGDVITEVNQKPVANPKQFRDALKAADFKKGVIISYTRGGTSSFEVLKDGGE
jgi:serine protease Do